MPVNPEHVALLRNLLEQSIGRTMHAPSDFEHMAAFINRKTGQDRSVSTLKRLWGYVEGYSSMRYSTLNLLASSVGYANWDTFVQLYCSNIDANSSDPIFTRHIDVATLTAGTCLRIAWLPDRECVISYIGENTFLVLKALNSKVRPGNTFRCTQFILGEALYVHNLVQDGITIPLFAMGKKGGLNKLEIVKMGENK